MEEKKQRRHPVYIFFLCVVVIQLFHIQTLQPVPHPLGCWTDDDATIDRPTVLNSSNIKERDRRTDTITSGLRALSTTLRNASDITTSSGFPLPHGTDQSIAFMVLSRRAATTTREAIRSTWGANLTNVFFVLGQPCEVPSQYRSEDGRCVIANNARVYPTEHYFGAVKRHLKARQEQQQELLEEQLRYGDLLMMDVVDEYRALPQKLKCMYQHVTDHLPSVKWTVKIDDDMFVKVRSFSNYLTHFLDAQKATVVGRIMSENAAHLSGKWKEYPQFPLGGRYPSFPLGSAGHAVSRSVSTWIVKHQKALFDLQGEDVSLGVWLSHPQAPPVTFHHTDVMVGEGKCEDPWLYIIGHDFKKAGLKRCQAINEKLEARGVVGLDEPPESKNMNRRSGIRQWSLVKRLTSLFS